MISTQSPQRPPLYKFLVVLFALAIALFITLPNYFSRSWVWQKVPEVPNIQQLKALQKEGINLPGWRKLGQETVDISTHKWAAQAMVPSTLLEDPASQNTVLLLMRPQTWKRDMPQVEWMDINGARRWTADSLRNLSFSVAPSEAVGGQPIQVNARFLRGWNEQRTYAVLQWYAYANGGSASPNGWFFADQLSQLFDRHRTSWVAVSLLLPIKPLGDISEIESEAIATGQLIQSTLMQTVLKQPT